MRPWQGGQQTAVELPPLEATMIDPFFYDRLMHAFTTTNSTPLSRAAAHAANSRPAAQSTGEASTCRAVQEAEAVVAAVLRRERTTQAEPNHPGDHTQSG
jgi:hypothetical protein